MTEHRTEKKRGIGDEGRDARYELRLAKRAYEKAADALSVARIQYQSSLTRLTEARKRCERLGV
jgi:hypothetical protein